MKLTHALFVCLSLMALPLRAADVNDLTYTTTNGEVTITDCDTSASGTLVIPDTIEGNPVTGIGRAAFFKCTSLASITIPDGVTSIENSTFYNCSSLTNITIPDSVTSIGGGAFSICTSLTNITIPGSVTSIGQRAFSFCSSLTSITIPDSVTSIGYEAFKDCKSLIAGTFLGDAPKVGKGVFAGAPPTIYRKAEAKGWGDTWGGRPVKLISEKP